MSNKELIELLKSCSPNIIYIIDEQNHILKLETPLKLLVVANIGNFQKYQTVVCTELKITTKGKIVFHIDGENYHTYYFDFIT